MANNVFGSFIPALNTILGSVGCTSGSGHAAWVHGCGEWICLMALEGTHLPLNQPHSSKPDLILEQVTLLHLHCMTSQMYRVHIFLSWPYNRDFLICEPSRGPCIFSNYFIISFNPYCSDHTLIEGLVLMLLKVLLWKGFHIFGKAWWLCRSQPSVQPLDLLGCYEAAIGCPELWEGIPLCSYSGPSHAVTRRYSTVNPWMWKIMTREGTKCGEREEKYLSLLRTHTHTHTQKCFLQGNLRVNSTSEDMEKLPSFKMWEAQEWLIGLPPPWWEGWGKRLVRGHWQAIILSEVHWGSDPL